MNEYLKKYPNDFRDIKALEYAIGYEKANKICEKAINDGKRIFVENSETELDAISYELK
mgnify:CR=1 FL=1